MNETDKTNETNAVTNTARVFGQKLFSKLTSRKFWITLIGVGAGIAQLFGADGESVSVVCGALMTLLPSVIYIITEGKIDKESAKSLLSSVSDAIDKVVGDENTDEKYTK